MAFRLQSKRVGKGPVDRTVLDRVTKHRDSRRAVPVPDIAPAAYRRRRNLESRPPAWLRHYWPDMYPLPFGPAHLAIIAEAQQAVRSGGMYAVAMGRGRGKTACLRGVAVWAVVTGLCRFPLLVAKTDKQASDLLDGVYKMLSSDLFAADYPEIANVYIATSGDPHRMRFATDARTKERFTATVRQGFVKLPHTFARLDDGKVLPCPASDAVIASRGITSHDLRGTHYVLPGGQILRPDLALVDDPETKESAKSSVQTQERIEIVHQDIRGLPGVGKALPILIGCTIMRRGCLADRVTDRDKSPEWRSGKYPMMPAMPTNEELWQQYNQLRLQGIADKDNGSKARAFYRRHRRAMDAGARVQWKHDVAPGSLSAVQTAMDMYLSDRVAFACEYQQEPEDTLSRLYVLTPDAVARQVNEWPRAAVPESAAYVTAGIDINSDAATWAVVAVRHDVCAWVLDYGIYPGGQSLLWSPDARYTVQDAIFRAVGELARVLAGRWPEMHRIAVDANYETETVYAAIAKHGPDIKPDLIAARGVGSKNYYVPSSKVGVLKIGEGCHILRSKGKGTSNAARKSVWFDSHQWHKRLQCGLLLPPSSAGAVSLFTGGEHRVFADHVTADVLQQIAIRDDGREVMTWIKPEEHSRNDLADAAKMAIVAAAVEGVTQHEQRPRKTQSAKIIRINR